MSLFNVFLSEHRSSLNGKGWTVIALLALASGLAGYLYMKPRACAQLAILCDNHPAGDTNLLYVNAPAVFSVNGKIGDDISWDFGDQTPKLVGSKATHVFTVPGRFVVRAVYQARCTTAILVTVRDQVATVVTGTKGQPVIQSPDVLMTGQILNLNAAGGHWQLIDAVDSQAHPAKNGRVSFATPGTRILELTMDKDPQKIYRKEIHVMPGPVKVGGTTRPVLKGTTPVPRTPDTWDEVEHTVRKKEDVAGGSRETSVEASPAGTARVVADQELKDKLNDIIDGREHTQNLAAYLCNGLNTSVVANKRWTDIQSFCRMTENNRRYEVTAVVTVRDSTTNCITYIRITFKKAFTALLK